MEKKVKIPPDDLRGPTGIRNKMLEEQKEREAKRRKIENNYNKTEEEIHTIEQRLSLIDDTMNLPEYATDVGKLTELAKEKEQLERELEHAMEAWETYAEQLEQFS